MIKGLERTNYCGEIDERMINEEITLMGWVSRKRIFSHFSFILLRDRTGIVQIVVNQDTDSQEIIQKDKELKPEYVIAIKGKVVARTKENINPSMPTGKVEVLINTLEIISTSKMPPFQIDDSVNVSTDLKLKYRYLDLRRPSMVDNLVLRHKISQCVRNFLDNENFLEVETPYLTKSTPEGARDYIVPSRVHKNTFYALPQSPQIFKQLLMISGIDKYFQIVKCFRDEDLRADRQPEFTQIDMELSFVDENYIMELNERLVKKIFKETKGIDIEIPFKRITYNEAMENYGSDKPDTRFDMKLKNISSVVKGSKFLVFQNAIDKGGSVRGIKATGAVAMPRKQIDALVDFSKTYGAKGLAWIGLNEDGSLKTSIGKFFDNDELMKILDIFDAKKGDIIFICADTDNIVFNSLGALRTELANRLELTSKNDFNLLWVTEFPLFEYNEDEKRYVAKHHPFTLPMKEDMDKLENYPEKVRAIAYDLVLNGFEIGGGSLRIYTPEVQEKMFKHLGFTNENMQNQFGFLLEALEYGAPPHGGIAFGLDRIAMILSNSESLREVMAFPKLKDASCPLTNAPNSVEKNQLDELNIKHNS